MSENSSSDRTSSGKNILKCRDDPEPVFFVKTGKAGAGETHQLVLADGQGCSWMKPGEQFGTDKIRPRIEPWLTALCQSEHLSLLLGSGLTHAIHLLGTGSALPGMSSGDFGDYDTRITKEAKRSAEAAGRDEGNIEDQIRAANELIRGLEILGLTKESIRLRANELKKNLGIVLKEFADEICNSEHNVITADESKRNEAFNYLVSFLMSFASRTGTRDRLQIFTTNYDRFIEAGAEVAGLHLLDRFVGSLAPIFRSSRLDLDMHYNPPGIRGEPRYLEGVARFTKLHGSLDWMDCEHNIRRIAIPFGTTSEAAHEKRPI